MRSWDISHVLLGNVLGVHVYVVHIARYGTAQMQRPTRSTTRCSLHARTRRLPSRVGKIATQKSLYNWFTTKLL